MIHPFLYKAIKLTLKYVRDCTRMSPSRPRCSKNAWPKSLVSSFLECLLQLSFVTELIVLSLNSRGWSFFKLVHNLQWLCVDINWIKNLISNYYEDILFRKFYLRLFKIDLFSCHNRLSEQIVYAGCYYKSK